MSGIYRSPVFAGPYSEAKLSGTAKLPFIGAFAELDAEMSFARMSPWNYVIGLGLRAGLSHLPDVEGRATHVTWGPVLYGSLRWRLNERWTGLAQLHFTVTRIPADKTPLDCIGPSVPGPETWDVWGGLSLGTEFTP
jgi:hypothetical protein